MILQEFTDEQYEFERERSSDWRQAFRTLVLAWASTQDPERPLLKLRAFKGIVSFTFRVRHLPVVVNLICGSSET